ncbi:MAG: hypothetical protein IPM46_02125 [Flavobacteriales bacterium]|nr:hypothetical protein [Flavobacteriales bacterium]
MGYELSVMRGPALKAWILTGLMFLMGTAVLAQHPVWPKFIPVSEINPRMKGKKVKLHPIGKPCTAVGRATFPQCREDSIYMILRGKWHLLRLVVDATIEGDDFRSMKLVDISSDHDTLVDVHNSRIIEVNDDSLLVDHSLLVRIRGFADRGASTKARERAWVDRMKLRGVSRPR